MNNTSSIIIRLQKLPWEATSADVREFFRGLNIPDGGVHIIGGRDGDAFIAFSTDEDARQAMRIDGKRIQNSKIKLLLSSRVEMVQVIEKARTDLQQLSQNSIKDKSSSTAGKHRSRSRSNERRHRSRSPSNERNRSFNKSAGGGLNQNFIQPPPNTPTAPISGYSSFRNDSSADVGPPRFNQPPKGMLDRNMPVSNIDNRFLDRTQPPPSRTFPSRHHGNAPPFDDGNSTFGNSSRQSNRPPRGSIENVRISSNIGGDSGFHAPPTQLIRPGVLAAPLGPGPVPLFNPASSNVSKFNEPLPFGGTATVPFGGMRARFDGPPPPSDRPLRHTDQSNAPSSFGGHQSQQLLPTPPTTAPAPVPGRASRRALLPAPPEEMADTNFVGENPSKNLEASFTNTDLQQPPAPQPLLETPFTEPLPGDWMGENNSQPPTPTTFPYNPAPHGRPTLLMAPATTTTMKKDIGLCISMTAVPNSMLRYGAIREFFHPIDLEGPDKIKIAVDEFGERTGEVYCKFLTYDDAELALTYTGREKIYIRTCTDNEFEKAIDGGLNRVRVKSKEDGGDFRIHPRNDFRHSSIGSNEYNDGNESVFVIEIKNIPYKATQGDLRFLLSQYNPLEIRRLYKHHQANGKVVTSDTAFAIFGNERDAMAALRTYDRRVLDRDVRILRSSVEAMENTFDRAPPAPTPDAVPEWEIKDRRDYKDRYHIDRRQKTRSRSPPPRHQSPQLPYERPTSPYRRYFNDTNQSKSDLKQESTSSTSSIPPTPIVLSSFQMTCVFMKGVALTATNRDVASFFQGLNIVTNGIRILKSTPGVAYVEFATASECEQALKKDRSYIGTQMVTIRACTKDEMMEAVHKQLNGGGGGNSPSTHPTIYNTQTTSGSSPNQQFFGNTRSIGGTNSNSDNLQQGNMESLYLQQLAALAKQQEEEKNANLKNQQNFESTTTTTNKNGNFNDASDMPAIDPEVVCSIGVPGCVAALHNLPSQISLEEICEIFREYQLIDDSIRMHYSNTGEATGDCLLAFATPRDAQNAMAALNGTLIQGQTIRMYVVPV